MARPVLPIAALAAVAGCSMPSGQPPSLATRAAETIDPRLPVGSDAPVLGPADPALAARLGDLLNQAMSGDQAFQAAAANAERLAASAGTSRSEAWIAAQQALSEAVTTRAATTRAMADIDALASGRIEQRQWIAPSDLAAIQTTAREVSAIDRRQADRIEAIERQLGL